MTVNAVSGYSGGGKAMIAEFEGGGAGAFRAYGLSLKHKHVPEMKKYSGLMHAPLFVPSVGHYAQGMLITVPITRDITSKQVTVKDVHGVLADQRTWRYLIGGLDGEHDVWALAPDNFEAAISS